MIDATDLPPGQKRVYDVILYRIRADGRSPSIRELGDILDISSPNGVICHIKALVKKGLIEYDHGISRGIRLPANNGHCRCCGQRLPGGAA